MQVAVLGEVPNQARGLKQLLQWGQAHRRRSLLSDGPPLAGPSAFPLHNALIPGPNNYNELNSNTRGFVTLLASKLTGF